MIRVQFAVFASFDAALAAGYADAEEGEWQWNPQDSTVRHGWIALIASEGDA